MSQKYLEAGKIVNTHGLRGEIKITPWTDYPEVYEEIAELYLEDGTAFEIKSVKYHKSSVIIKLKGVDDVNDAERLKNKVVYVLRESIDDLPDDTYFVVDLIGLEVFEGEAFLGKITEVISTGSNDVYVVSREGEKDILIPALREVVEEVNVNEGYMKVKIPEGLLD